MFLGIITVKIFVLALGGFGRKAFAFTFSSSAPAFASNQQKHHPWSSSSSTSCVPMSSSSSSQSPSLSIGIPADQRGPVIPGMTGGVHIGMPFCESTLAELERLGASKVFVLANKSSKPMAEPLLQVLEQRGILAAPVCTSIGMGGGEDGLLKAADSAAAVATVAGTDVVDCLVTIGGGAIQDAGKLIRLWLAADQNSSMAATADGIKEVTKLEPFPPLVPQICLPNSFAMAELSSVAGITLKNNVKSGASHPAIMPTTVFFDPALTKGLPNWVRFGTALRCVEHAVGAATHPNADEAQVSVALQGLAMTKKGMELMVQDPESKEAAENVYAGGWCAIRSLSTNGCYPALGHLVENMYSAAYNVHQGGCSGILCARILHHHAKGSKKAQERIANVLLGDDSDDKNYDNRELSSEPSAARLITKLVATLPGVPRDHKDAGVDPEKLQEFADSRPLDRFNKLSPIPFQDASEVLSMLILPLDEM